MNKTWKNLSAINVNDDKERKGRFDYLSWADAWKHVQNNVENATYELHDDVVYPDNSREVRCSVTIGGVTHMMWLAVMDNTNRAIKNPDARAINDARMRCLVKAIAMHGLGLYIYAGEDLPEDNDEQPASKKKEPKKEIDVSVHPIEPETPEEPEQELPGQMPVWQAYWHNGEPCGHALNTPEDYSEKLVEIFRKYQLSNKSQVVMDKLWKANFNLIDQLGEDNMALVDRKFKANKRMSQK